MLQWLIVDIREVSDGRERTKEDRIGDGLVMCGGEKKLRGEEVLQHHHLSEPQNYSRDGTGRRERKTE